MLRTVRSDGPPATLTNHPSVSIVHRRRHVTGHMCREPRTSADMAIVARASSPAMLHVGPDQLEGRLFNSRRLSPPSARWFCSQFLSLARGRRFREGMAGEIPSNSRISSAIRFLGLLKQPDSDSSALELDEREVVWSADFSYPSGVRRSSRLSPTPKNSINSAAASPSPPSSVGSRRLHAFQQEKSGLSAALAGENRSFVQRKAALDPLLSVSRNIPSPLPVPLSRSGSGSENFSGASGGSSGNYHQSAPVNVPAWPRTKRGSVNVQIFVDDEGEAEDEMLPPHLLVERASARSHVTTFSVFEGVGRTLKGRDLRRVRNAVFHKTGFLE